MKPWEVSPQLTHDRLVTLAKRVIEIRFDAILDHNPDKGDGAWGLGARVYERMIKQLFWASGKGEFPWLSVVLDGLYISLRIDGCAVRIYRGDPDNPSSNVLSSALREAEDIATHGPNGTSYFQGMEPPVNAWFWVMAVQTVGDGTPRRVVVGQLSDEGETRNKWTVPLDMNAIRSEVETKARGDKVEPLAKPPIEVGPVTVLPKASLDDVGLHERG